MIWRSFQLRSVFIVCAILIQWVGVSAQVKSIGLPKILNYKKSDYNGGFQNWDIEQDSKGNLYFGNTSGLLQFNGTSWSKTSLPNNTIRALEISGSGKIYVGGYNEFGYYNIDKKGKHKYHSLSSSLTAQEKRFMGFIWKVHIIDDIVVFQSFARAYIYRNNKVTTLDAPHRFQFSFLVNGKLYFQDLTLGLLEYKNGKLVPLKGTKVFNNTEVWSILPLPLNKLLITTLDKGLYIYDQGQVKPWLTEANTFVLKNNCLGGTILKQNNIVINSVLDGVIICDLEGKIVQHINTSKGLQNNTALFSFADSTNNLWLGLDNGISFVNENSPFSYLGTGHDLGAVYASVVHEGNVYVATNQGIFTHEWKIPFREEAFRFVEGTTGQAWNLQKIGDKLYGSHHRGLFEINNGKVQLLDGGKGYFSIKAIPGRPAFLMAANYNGFAIFEKTALGLKFRNQVRGFGIADNKFVTDGKYVWLEKDKAMYQLELAEDMQHFVKVKAHASPLKGLTGFNSVQELRNKTFFQTNNRFFTFENNIFKEDKIFSDLFKGLPPIRYCVEDKMGNIFYFYYESAMGMLMKQPNGGYTHVHAPFSSLTGNLIYFFESVHTVDSNNILIGLSEGLVHYSPRLRGVTYPAPRAYIRSFSFTGDTLVTGNMQKITSPDIPYASNNVKFAFSSPIYDNPENVLFSYKLDGFDDKWSSWSTAAIKEYTNLGEGTYTMQVKVINSFGMQSQPTAFTFTVSPPFYRHILAYLLYLIAAVGLVLYIRNSIRQKIRKNKYYESVEQRRLYLEKEAKIRQEQYELEKEIERLKNEQLKVKILTKDKELVNNSLQVAKKNKMLNGIISKLKDIDSETIDENAKVRLTKLYKSVSKELNTDKSWNNIEKHIRNVHFDFLKRLKEKYPAITPREMDLATYLLMNMSTKEISEIMNISDGGVELARYRLRKKLDLSRKENLIGFLMSI